MAYNPKDKNPSGVVLFGNNGSDQVFESVTGFVYDTGNTRLGINTSSPQYTLDVSGTGTFHTIRFADGTEMITSGGGGGGTTYTAGSGLTLDGTEFNVFGGSGNFQYIELKSSTQDPQIYFLGSGSNDTPITLNILSSYQSASSSGSALVFDGTEGQLFAITDNLSSGVIFSVADIAGLPLIEADASGDVQLIEFGRYVGVGTGTPQYQLDVFGTGRFSSGIIFPDGNRQTIAYTGGAGGGSMNSWDLGVGTESVIDVTDGESVTFSGLNQITTTRTAQRIDIDVNLSNYYTISQVDTISGNLQTQIDANDNYQYWTITDGVNSENVSTTDTIKFTGGGDVGVSYNTSNNTVTISATAGGGGTPGGNSTEFQYNNGGSFAGTTGVVYGATNGTGTIFEVHGTGQPKDSLFSVSYTGVTTPTTVSIYNNDGQTANVFQVLTSGSGDLFTVSPTGKIYYNSSYSNIANSGNIGSSMTFDLDTSNIFTGTLTTTSITLSTTNEDVGQRFMLRLKQDGTGSRTVGTWFGSRVKWPGGSAPTLSTGANLVDLFGFLVTSGSAGTFYYDGFTIATGIQ